MDGNTEFPKNIIQIFQKKYFEIIKTFKLKKFWKEE
jgi:hypothetical protein